MSIEREEHRDAAMANIEVALKRAIAALSWLGRGQGHLNFAESETREARRLLAEAETSILKALTAEKRS